MLKSFLIGSLAFSGFVNAALHMNDIPAKYQWQNNFGYCGELSYIQGGLYYGQYCSQFDSRAMSTPGVSQALNTSQLLLGYNDDVTARNMRLNVTRWGRKESKKGGSHGFLLWVKEQVVQGNPVTIGILMNQYLFDMTDGDDEYDHIITVSGIESDNLYDWTNFNANDKLILDDHYEFEGGVRRDYSYTFDFGSFVRTRAEADATDSPLYSLAYPPNYGASIHGIKDENQETLRATLTTNKVKELPVMKDGSNTRPKANPVKLTLTVSGLVAGQELVVYRYDRFSHVPVKDFHAHSDKACKSWNVTATGATWEMSEWVYSSQQVAYRAVKVQ